ncbi:MAG: DNA polymerase III, subunit gamma and tau [Treponema sp. CETP13]|nr:MAG: DNA polymerase III, subunit gamma and tau [Treponema sp. CETP13]
MAYEVTATRLRPQKFSDLVGQDFVVATLENAIKSGKVAHAYLFSGPRGCGKTSSARILAKMLNCEKGVEQAPCGECIACKEIAKGSCMDVIEIDGASNTSVNDVRQIKDEILFPPNSCKYKIYIIDEVHMLSTSAFNALLKTIEEPPPYVIFIFATTEIHKVPATIKSRCQQFNFRLGSVEQIKDLLTKTVVEMGIKADEEALYWISRESTGSFRDAYTLLDQVAAFSNGYITFDKIREKLGITGVEQLNNLCEVCITGNTSKALELIDEILEVGVSIEQFITNITDYLRNLLLIKSGITKEGLLGQSSNRFSKPVIDAWSCVQIEHALSLFLQLYRDVRYSLNPRYELELNISRLCWLTDWVSAKDMKNAIAQAKNLLNAGSDSVTPTVTQMRPSQMQQNERNLSRPFVNSGDLNPVTAQTQKKEPNNKIQSEQKPFISAKETSSIKKTEDVFSDITVDSTLSIQELRDVAIKEYGRIRPLVAAALMQTSEWSVSGSIITTSIEQPFTKKQITEWNKEINNLLSHIWEKSVTFNVELKKTQKKTEYIPETVEYICQVFNGSVTSVNKTKKLQGEDNEH